MLVQTYLSSGWEFCETPWLTPRHKIGYTFTEWLPANVPGHVHLDLQDSGIIPDPFERMNEIGVQWVDDKDWTYRCSFEWTAQPDLPNRVLRFEGLDTLCKIYLNDELIGESDNMFIPVELDVTNKLVSGQNEIRIDFQSAKKVGEVLRKEYLEKEGMTLDRIRFDERAFVRKIQCMYGWDWGPRLISCGVWKPVSILEFESRILDVQTYQDWSEDGSVKLRVETTIQGDGELVASLSDYGVPEITGTSGVFEIQDPLRWEPIGVAETFAEQTMLTVQLFKDDVLIDEREISIGFNQIQLLREKDEIGESFEFLVNGKKVFVRGANWIPDHSFPSIVDRARLEERIGQAVDLGCNMLRVWGGGAYESNEFYEVCSEMGVMVWQDFLFACSYYPDDEIHQEIIRKEAQANILRLRNYPCLALWCGNNENLQMWQQKWEGAEFAPPRYYGEKLYDGTLPKAVAEFDPGRSYINTSPCGESQPDANGGKIGDSHCWDVWHGRGDWKHYADSEARFSSEYGFAAPCSLALWEETLADEDWHHRSVAVRWHNKTLKPQDVFEGYVNLHYPESQSLEDWTYYAQLNQRDAFRFGVEFFRRSSFCRGSLIWQLNDCWPVQSWAVIDSSGRYKAAAYELRRLHDNSLLSLQRKNDKVFVHFVNDEPMAESLETTIVVKAINLETGVTLNAWQFEAESSFNDRIVVGEVDLNGLSVPDTILVAYTESGGNTWHLLGEPKESRFAQPERLLGHCGYQDDSLGGGPVLDLQITVPVVDLMLSVDGDTSFFDDNFLTFAEPGVYRIRLNGIVDAFEARSLAGEHRTQLTRSPLS